MDKVQRDTSVIASSLDKARKDMNTFAGILDRALNREGDKQWGFGLLVFPLDPEKPTPVFHVSNADRPTVLSAMKRMTANLEFDAKSLHPPGHA